MRCSLHWDKPVSKKCVNCSKFVCAQCAAEHSHRSHQLLSLVELSQAAQQQIAEQLAKIDATIRELSSSSDLASGQAVIDLCEQELMSYIRALFQQMREEYRSRCDRAWALINQPQLEELEQKKLMLLGWSQAIRKKKEKVQEFEEEQIVRESCLLSEESLLDSIHVNRRQNKSPRIQFNEIALRRAHESLSKVIYIAESVEAPQLHNLKRFPSRQSVSMTQSGEYLSVCKFIEGTAIMYEFVIQDPTEESFEPSLRRMQFRQFLTPMRSVSVCDAGAVYLLGGHGREKKHSKEVWMYDRAYNTMRIVGLLKEGRVGHAVCCHSEKLYVFGGDECNSLEQFNTKSRSSQILGKYEKNMIMGSSIVCLQGKVYIFGGLDPLEPNLSILVFDLAGGRWHEVQPCNSRSYTMPISPVLCPISEDEILIFGGYFISSGQHFINSSMCSLNTKLFIYAQVGKGELPYPLLSSGQSSVCHNGRVCALAEMKRERHRHGPNLIGLVTYWLKEDILRVEPLGL